MNRPNGYRPDIDGLRALAIVAVIFYHFKIFGFTGGFTGVDVFFVVSGYLISGIILRETAANTFSLTNFAARRVRRIIPALVFVLLATVGTAYSLLLLPPDFIGFGKSLMFQSVFLSNMWFMSLSSYFSAPTETMPLLHTWTLAIEEQFYILFPLLALLVYPYVKKKFRLVMVGLALASFAYSVFLINIAPTEKFNIPFLPNLWGSATNAAAGFYFIVPRLWEFMVGGIIVAYALTIKSRVVAEAVSLSGLAAILTGIFLLTEDHQFPGVSALLPVLGTAAVIVGNTSHHTLVKSLLSFKLVVFVGLLSYSLYLWHWPVWVLSQYQLFSRTLSNGEKLLLIVLIFFLSWFTYHFVETPVRQKRYLGEHKRLFIAGLVSVLALFVAGYGIVKNQGFPERLSANGQIVVAAMNDKNPRRAECFTKAEFAVIQNDEPCLLGMQKPTEVSYVVWGDSQADAAMPAFDEYGKKTGRTGAFFGAGSCFPLLSKRPITDDQLCRELKQRAISYINDNSPEEVFIVSEWRGNYPLTEVDERIKLSTLLQNTLEQVPSSTKINVVRRLPIFRDLDLRQLFFQVELESLGLNLGASRSYYENVHSHYNAEIDLVISTFENATTLNPIDTFCDNQNCYLGSSEGLYFRDSSHLSTYGAEQIILPLLLEDEEN